MGRIFTSAIFYYEIPIKFSSIFTQDDEIYSKSHMAILADCA